MRAATASELQTPSIGWFDAPMTRDGCELIDLRAAALTNLDVAVAQRQHYFANTPLPFVIGREGVAIAPDGQRNFYPANSMVAPYGSMAEQALVRAGTGLPVPDDTPDDLAAALGNAGLAAWLPLSWRARMTAGETVLILGATGTSGLIAVSAARLLGAKHIVAAGRNAEALQKAIALGADAVIDLNALDGLSERIAEATRGGADIVIDYLNGPPAEAALMTMRQGGRMVQVGSPLSPGITVNAQNARQRSSDVLGFAYYHAPHETQAEAYRQLCKHALSGDVHIAIHRLALTDFQQAWQLQLQRSRSRIVIIP